MPRVGQHVEHQPVAACWHRVTQCGDPGGGEDRRVRHRHPGQRSPQRSARGSQRGARHPRRRPSPCSAPGTPAGPSGSGLPARRGRWTASPRAAGGPRGPISAACLPQMGPAFKKGPRSAAAGLLRLRWRGCRWRRFVFDQRTTLRRLWAPSSLLRRFVYAFSLLVRRGSREVVDLLTGGNRGNQPAVTRPGSASSSSNASRSASPRPSAVVVGVRSGGVQTKR